MKKEFGNDFNVEIIGVDIDAINICEDREQFKQLLKKIGIPVAPCQNCYIFFKRKRNCSRIWFSLMLLDHLLL
jgi:carbamoyl-phosphate synthase large subunit